MWLVTCKMSSKNKNKVWSKNKLLPWIRFLFENFQLLLQFGQICLTSNPAVNQPWYILAPRSAPQTVSTATLLFVNRFSLGSCNSTARFVISNKRFAKKLSCIAIGHLLKRQKIWKKS